MIVSFRNRTTENIFDGVNSKAARKMLPQILWRLASRKLDQLDSVQLLEEMRVPPGNQFEKLTGNRRGEHSIRINSQYRVCFMWEASGPYNVEITDYH